MSWTLLFAFWFIFLTFMFAFLVGGGGTATF